MHKKLAADLISLAHSILQIKDQEDIFILKKKSYEVYEKLAVLAYVEEYINTTPNATETKETLLDKIEKASQKLEINAKEPVTIEEETIAEKTEEPVTIEEEAIAEKAEEPITIEEETIAEKTEEPVNTLFEQPFDALEETLFEEVVETKVEEDGEKKGLSLEEELQDTISVDVTADLFEKVTPKRSLNDHLQKDISIGLNDRIAFVKSLFDGNQESFNKAILQLNSFKTIEESKNFIDNTVKSDYSWEGKEELEERFVNAVTLKFG